MTNVKILLAAAAFAVGVSSAAKADNTSMATNAYWYTPEAVAQKHLTQEACHNYSVTALNRARAEDLDVMKSSVYGTVDGYGVVIRCEMDQRVVFFASAGPTGDGAGAALQKVMDAWDGEKKQESVAPQKRQLKKREQRVGLE